MVSPGNPLKHTHGMAPIADRLASAQTIADGRRIIATDIEARLGTRYTMDTLRKLRKIFPCAHFVWLMGADNLAGFPRWRGWQEIARMMPFAVHPRPTYNLRALAGQAARHLHASRRSVNEAPVLADQRHAAWMFLPASQHAASATALREAGQFEASGPRPTALGQKADQPERGE
jgi:nicotinate-nucleotide adenylyltransferase